MDVSQHGVDPRAEIDRALGPADLRHLDHQRPEGEVELDHPIQVVRGQKPGVWVDLDQRVQGDSGPVVPVHPRLVRGGHHPVLHHVFRPLGVEHPDRRALAGVQARALVQFEELARPVWPEVIEVHLDHDVVGVNGLAHPLGVQPGAVGHDGARSHGPRQVLWRLLPHDPLAGLDPDLLPRLLGRRQVPGPHPARRVHRHALWAPLPGKVLPNRAHPVQL